MFFLLFSNFVYSNSEVLGARVHFESGGKCIDDMMVRLNVGTTRK